MVKKSKFVIVLFLVVCCTTLTAQENIRLKVLTYNLRFGELASLEELAEFIKSQDPDVVALQEVDVKTYRKWIPQQNGKDFITELGFRTGMLTAYAKTIPFANGYYGIGILSKFPFAETRKYLLPIPEGSKEQRALLLANVELSDGNIFTFICTHLDYPSSEVRQVQVAALTEILKGNPYPMILAGDFNASPDAIEINSGMANWLQVSTSDFTFPASGPKAKIDYIFCYPDSNWVVDSASTPQVKLSDHLPVCATLQLQFP